MCVCVCVQKLVTKRVRGEVSVSHIMREEKRKREKKNAFVCAKVSNRKREKDFMGTVLIESVYK
jgi:hypothetical protein